MNILFDLSGCNQPYNAITAVSYTHLWGDVVRVFRPLLCGGEEGGRKDGQHEAAPAVQLRVCPVLG